MAQATNYEYPSGQRPTPEEQELFEVLASILEGRRKNFVLSYIERDKLKVLHGCKTDTAINLASRSTTYLNEKRQNEDDGA